MKKMLKKNCFVFDQEKKCLLLLRSQNVCTFKLRVEEKFDNVEKPKPPLRHVSSPPLKRIVVFTPHVSVFFGQAGTTNKDVGGEILYLFHIFHTSN